MQFAAQVPKSNQYLTLIVRSLDALLNQGWEWTSQGIVINNANQSAKFWHIGWRLKLCNCRHLFWVWTYPSGTENMSKVC